MTTPDQQPLTMVEVTDYLARIAQAPWSGEGLLAVRMARALLASQTALRQARSDLIVAGMIDAAKATEAALLPKGEDDEAPA